MTDPEKRYKRLYVSLEDFRYASSYAGFILKKHWHFYPWEKRESIYVQQSAFTSALIVSYSRPFTVGYGYDLPDPSGRLPLPSSYDAAEKETHEEILKLRNQVFAHSDGSHYEVKPVLISGAASAIIGAPFFRLAADEVRQLRGMIEKAMTAIDGELQNLIRDVPGVDNREIFKK
jgi:hypothetical protein